MDSYSKYKKQEHLSVVRKTMIGMPTSSVLQMQKALANSGYDFSMAYITRMMKKVSAERATRFDRQTKSMICATFEDFVKDLEPKLREILRGGKNYEKIEAIKVLVDNYKKSIEMQMDLGVLDRNLGKVSVENYHFDIIKIAKLIEKANKMKQEDDGRNNYIGT